MQGAVAKEYREVEDYWDLKEGKEKKKGIFQTKTKASNCTYVRHSGNKQSSAGEVKHGIHIIYNFPANDTTNC